MSTPENPLHGELPCSPELAKQVHDRLAATLGIVGVGATAESPFNDEVDFSQIPHDLREVTGMTQKGYQEYSVSLAPGNNSIPYTEADWPGGIGITVTDFGDNGREGYHLSTYFEPGFEDHGVPTIRKHVYEIPKIRSAGMYFGQSCPVPQGGHERAIAEAESQLASLEESAALTEDTRINRATDREAIALLELLNSF